MSPPLSTSNLLLIFFLNFLLIQSTLVNAESQLQPRKLLDEITPPTGEIKCGGCSSCSNPCAKSPPPPSPTPPPPPSPPKKPPVVYCPPPPDPYIYITGPPGDLYPVVTNYDGSAVKSTAGPLIVFSLFVAGFL